MKDSYYKLLEANRLCRVFTFLIINRIIDVADCAQKNRLPRIFEIRPIIKVFQAIMLAKPIMLAIKFKEWRETTTTKINVSTMGMRSR